LFDDLCELIDFRLQKYKECNNQQTLLYFFKNFYRMGDFTLFDFVGMTMAKV